MQGDMEHERSSDMFISKSKMVSNTGKMDSVRILSKWDGKIEELEEEGSEESIKGDTG